MPRIPALWPVACMLVLGAPLVSPTTAPAQSPAPSVEALDQLSLSSETPEQGLALARSQAAQGDMLEALATLERTLSAKPKNKQARLLHASLLCRLDDRQGAEVEFARLKAKDFGKAEWAVARAPCEGVATPRGS